jgi:hypothetical protein
MTNSLFSNFTLSYSTPSGSRFSGAKSSARRAFAIAFALTLVAGIQSGCKQSGPSSANHATFHRYGMQHAHVHFEYSGYARGPEDLYFDQYGGRETRISDFEHLDDEKFSQIHMTKIQVNSDVWILQDDKHTGTHFFNVHFDSLMAIDADSNLTPEKASANLLESQHASLMGTDTVLGLRCDVWQLAKEDKKLYIYEGLLLKTESKRGEEYVISSPTLIDTTSPIDESKFKPNPSFKIQESQGDKH